MLAFLCFQSYRKAVQITKKENQAKKEQKMISDEPKPDDKAVD